MNLISSYDSDEGLISTFSDEFNEEDDALLPSSKTKRRFEIASQEKDGPDSIQFRTGRKKKLQKRKAQKPKSIKCCSIFTSNRLCQTSSTSSSVIHLPFIGLRIQQVARMILSLCV